MIQQKEITLSRYSRGYHMVTHVIKENLPELPEKGLLHILVKHTSAGITLNENADPSVRDDFNGFLDQLIPENHPVYTHTLEGPDDMPAHIKAALVGSSISVPISNGRLQLGTWQGIYLCEFRNHPRSRTVIATIYS